MVSKKTNNKSETVEDVAKEIQEFFEKINSIADVQELVDLKDIYNNEINEANKYVYSALILLGTKFIQQDIIGTKREYILLLLSQQKKIEEYPLSNIKNFMDDNENPISKPSLTEHIFWLRDNNLVTTSLKTTEKSRERFVRVTDLGLIIGYSLTH